MVMVRCLGVGAPVKTRFEINYQIYALKAAKSRDTSGVEAFAIA